MTPNTQRRLRVVRSGIGARVTEDTRLSDTPHIRPTTPNKARGHSRSQTTLLAGPDRGTGWQPPLVSISSDGQPFAGREWDPDRLDTLGSVVVESCTYATLALTELVGIKPTQHNNPNYHYIAPYFLQELIHCPCITAPTGDQILFTIFTLLLIFKVLPASVFLTKIKPPNKY